MLGSNCCFLTGICISQAAAFSNSVKLWAMSCRATQDRWVTVESSDKMWFTGEGNGKPCQYSCLENPLSSMKRQKDWTLKEILWIPLFKITLHWIPHLFPALPIHSSDPNSEPECPPSDCSPLPITWQTPTSDQSLSSLLLIWLPYYFSSLTGFFWSCCLSPDPHPFFPDLLQ